MTEKESGWNMGDKFYMLVLAIKEQYITAVSQDDPRAMLKWAQSLSDEVRAACNKKEKEKLDKLSEQAEQAVWSAGASEKGLYEDDQDQAKAYYDAMKAAGLLYRELVELMFDKKMVIPWEAKRDLGKASLELE